PFHPSGETPPMSMHYFIATADEIACPEMLDGPEHCDFPWVASDGVDCFALSSLDELVTGASCRMPELVFEEGEEGPSLWHVSPDLLHAIASLSGTELIEIAGQWSENEEWEVVLSSSNAAKFLEEFLRELFTLAKQGREEDRQLFLWICL
ncbi:MAG: hypothetical protein N2C14_25085, partial [Planctomycetales bacterium]